VVTTPYQRRRDPQPTGQGWEVAAAAVGGALLVVGLGALAGLGLASALWGGGWVWPHGTDTITHVLGEIAHGRPGRGLPAGQRRLVAGRGPVYGCVAALELTLAALAAGAGVLIGRYRRPGDARGGMATRSEAALVLGISALRSAKSIIRPDRYGPQPTKERRQ